MNISNSGFLYSLSYVNLYFRIILYKKLSVFLNEFKFAVKIGSSLADFGK